MRLEGFEPPTRGLEMRAYSSHTILACQQIPKYRLFTRFPAVLVLPLSYPVQLRSGPVAVHQLLCKGGVVEYDAKHADP